MPTVGAKIKFRFVDHRTVVLPRYVRYLNGEKTERSTALFQNGTAVPLINKHCLTVATFSFLRSTVTDCTFQREISSGNGANLSKVQANSSKFIKRVHQMLLAISNF